VAINNALARRRRGLASAAAVRRARGAAERGDPLDEQHYARVWHSRVEESVREEQQEQELSRSRLGAAEEVASQPTKPPP
jgi:hypothetical protein